MRHFSKVEAFPGNRGGFSYLHCV